MSALDGIRVLDFGFGVAAPIVGAFLADFGADVVKVEPPTGDPSRARAGFPVFNRNKKSVVVDRASAVDRDWLLASVRGADVVILGAGQSLADWGAEIELAAQQNEALILTKLPAFLEGYSPWGSDTESNGLISAASGQATRQSSFTGGPIESVSDLMLYDQGVWAAACVVAALVERESSQRGQVISVGGMNGAQIAIIASSTVDPNVPTPPVNIGPWGRSVSYMPFATKDGWISSGALGQKFVERLFRTLGLGRILDDPRIANVTERMLLPDNRPWVLEAVTEAFAAHTTADMLEFFERIGIPAGELRPRDEWLDHPQVEAIGMRVSVEDPERGEVVMPGVPIVLTKTPGSVRTSAPVLGQHNGRETWPAKSTTDDIAPRYVPGPLKGLRALNLGTFVAGPMAGFLLAELGAEVVKVEPLGGDPFRPTQYQYNRGMKSIAIDLATDAGRHAFHELAKNVDVVMDSMRPGVTRKLGIDHDALTSANPTIITTSLSGYGEGGPLGDRPLVDMVLQAMSGMMGAQGGDDEPVANTIAVNDVTTGALSVLMTVLAYYHRLRTDEGQRCWNSLAATSCYLQSEEIVRFEGRPAAPVGGRDFRGASPLKRYHKAQDGWIYVDADDVSQPVAEERVHALGLAGPEGIGVWVEELTVEQALHRLSDVGLRATRAVDVVEMLRDPELIRRDIVHYRNADDGSTIGLFGNYASFSRTQRRGPMCPPGISEQAVELLTAAGLSHAEVDDLIAGGVVQAAERAHHLLGLAYR